VLDGRLCDKQKTEHIDVEYLVELVFRERFNRRELVHARVIHQDVEATVVLMAASMMPWASAAFETSPPTATALPPAALMAVTTLSAPFLLDA
jgi:hypothetical protein